MNKDISEGKWEEMCGQVKAWWGKHTHDDLEQAGGDSEEIVGLLQQKYGYTPQHQQAEDEFNLQVEDAKDVVK